TPVERLALGEAANAAEHELIAVGRSLGDAAGADRAAGATDVLDDHALPEHLRQAGRQHAAERIDGAARREGDDHGHRAGRPSLLGRAGWCEQCERGGDAERTAPWIWSAHGCLPQAARATSMQR